MLFQENMRDCLLNLSISSFSLTPHYLLTNSSLFYLSTNKFSPSSAQIQRSRFPNMATSYYPRRHVLAFR